MHHHRAKDIVWISVLTVAFVLGACGKSETPTAEKAAPLTSAPAGDKAAAPKAGADKAPAPTKAATPSAGAASDKAPAVSRVELPDDVVAVAAVRSLDGILTSAKAALELLDPAAAQPGFVSA